MIKYVLPAAVAALALGTMVGAPAAVHAQMAPPMQPALPNTATNANATIIGQPQPGPNDYYDQGYAAPMPAPYALPISPRTTWIPGHYEWDPNTSNYVYAEGSYVEAPRDNAQWIPGHWVQTPTSWIWMQGRWS